MDQEPLRRMAVAYCKGRARLLREMRPFEDERLDFRHSCWDRVKYKSFMIAKREVR